MMPRKSKEVKPKKEEVPELNRRRSARLAVAEPKVKVKEDSPAKTPKRQAAKRASTEVTKTMAEEENIHSNVESNASLEKVEPEGDKITEVEAKKLKLDEEKVDEEAKPTEVAAVAVEDVVTTEEASKLVIDSSNDNNVEEKAAEEVKGVDETTETRTAEQNHVNSVEIESVEPSATAS